MAKKPTPSAPPAKRRGRPPKPGGPIPQAEIQRRYRARLVAAGKVVRLIDAGALNREAFNEMQGRLENALLNLELREQDLAQIEQRNAYLEGELRRLEQIHTVTLKEVITLKKELAGQGAGKPPENRSSRRR